MYRVPQAAPASQLPPERRGPVVGRFCKACGAVYPKFRTRHSGKSLYGRDHISSPCSHEGEPFEPGDAWWEPAVQPLSAPPAAVAVEGAAG